MSNVQIRSAKVFSSDLYIFVPRSKENNITETAKQTAAAEFTTALIEAGHNFIPQEAFEVTVMEFTAAATFNPDTGEAGWEVLTFCKVTVTD